MFSTDNKEKRTVFVPVSSSVHPRVHTHVQFQSGVNHLLKLRPLVPPHTWKHRGHVDTPAPCRTRGAASAAPVLTDADVPGLLADLHLHIPAEPLAAFPAVPGPRRIKVGVRGEALIDGGDGGRGDRRGGRVGLAARAAGGGRHRVGLGPVLLQREQRCETGKGRTGALF